MAKKDETFPKDLGKVVKIHRSNMAETDKGFTLAASDGVVVGALIYKEAGGQISVEKPLDLQQGVSNKLFDRAVELGKSREDAQLLSKIALESFVSSREKIEAMKEAATSLGMTEQDVKTLSEGDLQSFLQDKQEKVEPSLWARLTGGAK